MVLIFAAFLLATGAVLYFSGPEPATITSLVKYSTVLSNSSNESYLGLDIQNPDGMQNEMEMMLPPNVDRSISARGGVVTISHAANTLVRLNSSSDASVKIYLSGNWTSLPVTMSLGVPEGYDSAWWFTDEDYFVTRKDDTILLRFNLTHEGVDFEQSYSPSDNLAIRVLKDEAEAVLSQRHRHREVSITGVRSFSEGAMWRSPSLSPSLAIRPFARNCRSSTRGLLAFANFLREEVTPQELRLLPRGWYILGEIIIVKIPPSWSISREGLARLCSPSIPAARRCCETLGLKGSFGSPCARSSPAAIQRPSTGRTA